MCEMSCHKINEDLQERVVHNRERASYPGSKKEESLAYFIMCVTSRVDTRYSHDLIVCGYA